MNKTVSYFRVYHLNDSCLGVAKMTGKRVSYKTDSKQYAWFEARDFAWLRDFRAVVYKLCRSVGHTSKFSISEDVDSGIRVERLSENSKANY